jgi:hypothetical protein
MSKRTTQTKQTQETQPEQAAKLSWRACAQQVVARIEADSQTTLEELAVAADELYRAGRDGDTEVDTDTAEAWVRAILEDLEALGLCTLEWHAVIHAHAALGRPRSPKS